MLFNPIPHLEHAHGNGGKKKPLAEPDSGRAAICLNRCYAEKCMSTRNCIPNTGACTAK